MGWINVTILLIDDKGKKMQESMIKAARLLAERSPRFRRLLEREATRILKADYRQDSRVVGQKRKLQEELRKFAAQLFKAKALENPRLTKAELWGVAGEVEDMATSLASEAALAEMKTWENYLKSQR